MRELGLAAAFTARAPLSAYGIASSWGSLELRMHGFESHPEGRGWQVTRPAFDEMIVRGAVEHGTEIARARAVGIRTGERGWEFE